MRYFTSLLVLCLFLSCSSNSTRKFQFRSVGWIIYVPSNLDARDSLDWSKLYPGPPDATGMQQRILLRVTDSSQFRLNAPYLIAAIEPFQKDKQEWSVVLQEMRKEWVDGYTKDYLPKATIDSVYSTEIIDGVEFDKTYFKMRRLKTTEHRYVYSRIINGLTFHCAINYLDTVQGKIYTSMFRQSKFDK